MSPRHFDPDELDQPSGVAEQAITELERYEMTSDADAPRGLADRVMAAIEHEPAPRRGLLAWLASPSPTGGAGRFVRVGAVAATLVLAVAGALFAGQLADLVRDVGNGPSPTPSVAPSPSDSPSALPSPSSSETPIPSGTSEGSDDPGGEVETAQPTANPTPDETPDDSPEETGTPRPSATASPTATPAP